VFETVYINLNEEPHGDSMPVKPSDITIYVYTCENQFHEPTHDAL